MSEHSELRIFAESFWYLLRHAEEGVALNTSEIERLEKQYFQFNAILKNAENAPENRRDRREPVKTCTYCGGEHDSAEHSKHEPTEPRSDICKQVAALRDWCLKQEGETEHSKGWRSAAATIRSKLDAILQSPEAAPEDRDLGNMVSLEVAWAEHQRLTKLLEAAKAQLAAMREALTKGAALLEEWMSLQNPHPEPDQIDIETDEWIRSARSIPAVQGEPVKRYIVDRGRLEVWGNRVVFGIESRNNWREVPLMPIEVEQEPHKGIWVLVLEREALSPETEGEKT